MEQGFVLLELLLLVNRWWLGCVVGPVQPSARNFYRLLAVAPDKYKLSVKGAPFGRPFFYQTLSGFALASILVSWVNPNHYPPWVVLENEVGAFAAVLLAALAIAFRGGQILAASSYISIVFFTMLLVLVQYGMGMVSWQVLGVGSLYLGAFSLSIYVGYGLHSGATKDNDQLEKLILAAALLGTIFSSGVVLGQWLQITTYYPPLMSDAGGGRPFGNLGQPNNQGTLLLTGILCAEMLLRKHAISAWAACMSVLTLVLAIAATGSRTAILGAVIAVLYLLVVGRAKRYSFTLGWILALVLCFIVLPKLGMAGEAGSARLNTSMADSPRMHIYQQLIWAILDKPWAGYGWMQTAYAQSIAAMNIFGGVETDYAHNLVIDFLVWFGIPLGALLLLSFGSVVVSNWRRSAANYRMAYVLLVPFAVHSMLEFPFAYAFFLLPAGALLGYLGGHVLIRSARVVRPVEVWLQIATPLLVLTSCLGIVICIDYLKLSEDFRVLKFENRNVGSVPDDFRQSTPLVLEDMRFMMDMIRYTPHPAESQERIAKIHHYILHAHNPGAQIKRISLEILDQNFDAMDIEIRRFKNLYSEQIVIWGMTSLRAAYCESNMPLQNYDRVCSMLSKTS
jgi:hypothetical protein